MWRNRMGWTKHKFCNTQKHSLSLFELSQLHQKTKDLPVSHSTHSKGKKLSPCSQQLLTGDKGILCGVQTNMQDSS